MKKIWISLCLSVAMLLSAATVVLAENNTTEFNSYVNQTVPVLQGYTLEEGEPTVQHTTRVKVEWTVTDVEVTYSPSMKWDAENLKWVEDTENRTYQATDGGAKFTFTNYGSEDVMASASFTPALGLEDAINGDVVFGNNNCTVKTPVTPAQSLYEESDFTALSQTVTATVKVNADRFADLPDTDNGNLGTYTLKISATKITLTFTGSNSHSTLSYNETDYAYGESFSFTVPVNSVISIVGAGTSQSTLTVDGKTVTQTSTSGWPCQWGTPNGRPTNGTVVTGAMDIHSASK